MGTTLANLHILDGDGDQLCALFPKAAVGQWSDRFVSVYEPEFLPGLSEKAARALSKKLTQPVLLVWIFDSDAVGFVVYQNGKMIANHVMSPDGYSKMGNIALFCECLGLPTEDVPRLRVVWKKGDAEEQLTLTVSLLGLPLLHNCKLLPDKQHCRDYEVVDQWIAERPALPKIKNETKALLIQELTCFRWNYHYIQTDAIYSSVEPYDDEYSYDQYQFWIADADGILSPGWRLEEDMIFQAAWGRVLGVDVAGGEVLFDSAGLLPERYPIKGMSHFLPEGRFLRQEQGDSGAGMTFICCAPDGSELWWKSGKHPWDSFFACENSEIIFTVQSDEASWLERIDTLTGQTIEKLPRPFGFNVWSKAYHDGCWWIAHNGDFLKEGKKEKGADTLTKLDSAFRIMVELPIPTFTQGLFFSPEHAYVYAFFYQNQVMVLDADTLAIQNTLIDKSYLGPLGFDSAGRFWLLRGHSTVEAWDAGLVKTLSRHKLKGEVMGHHQNERGVMCIVTWSKKEKILRVYQFM